MRTWADEVQEAGFAIIPDLVPTKRADHLLEETAALPRSRAGIRHAMNHPSIAAIANETGLLEIARLILGPQAFPYRATVFDKSRNSNWLVVWHQDTALPLTQKDNVTGWGPWSTKDGVLYAHAPAGALSQVLALRIHLDHSNTENGSLRVLPGTHNQGVLTDDEIQAEAAKTTAVECTVRRGGVLAMRPLLVHASSKSHSEVPRRVLHIEYAAMRVLDGFCLAVA